jgi:triacylglycerol lipase
MEVSSSTQPIHRAESHEGRESVKQAPAFLNFHARIAAIADAIRQGPTVVASLIIPQAMLARLDAPIVLAHGLFGFKRIGVGRLTVASYFRGIPEALIAAGNRVLVTHVPALAGVDHRAKRLGDQIQRAFPQERVHVIGHSMGGLDARRLLEDPSWQKQVLTLTTIGTPHLGTSVADFAKLRVGRVYRLLSAMGIDPQGCLDITRRRARQLNRRYPAPANVLCFSVAGDPAPDSVCWPLRRTHAALTELEGPNDGLVSVESALEFGTPLPCWPVDHLRQLNWLPGEDEPSFPSVIDLYAQVIAQLASLGFGTSPRQHHLGKESASEPFSGQGTERLS